jgi:hypothetical protein
MKNVLLPRHSMRSGFPLEAMLLASAVLLSACGADDGLILAELHRTAQAEGSDTGPNDGAPPPTSASIPPSDSFPKEKVAAINALLTQRCLPCHGSEPPPGSLPIASIDDIEKIAEPYVVQGSPEESVIYVRASRGEMPPVDVADDFPRLQTDELTLLREVIELLPIQSD